jgi:hypothetical protein
MARDIFEFWSGIADNACHHPDDKSVFERVGHHFELDCLPTSFMGPLRSAPVVLLFLSLGYTKFDSVHARSPVGQQYYRSQRSGDAPLPSANDHEPAHEWWTRIVRQFDIDLARAATSFAVLNLGAYHSEKFHDHHMLTALPSSRVALDWAHYVLFPAAQAGSRVVICLRASRLWGLGAGEQYGQSLFSPRCTPDGKMHKGALREKIRRAVQAELGIA